MLSLCSRHSLSLLFPQPHAEFDALKLLVELSHSGVYTRRSWDGPTLPRETLLQLIKLANMLEFTCEKMGEGPMGTETSMSILNFFGHMGPSPNLIHDLIDKAVCVLGRLEGFGGQGRFNKSSSRAVMSARIPIIKVR